MCRSPKGSRVKAEALTLWNRAGQGQKLGGAAEVRKGQDVRGPSWWEVRAADGPERQATEHGMYQSERPGGTTQSCAVQFWVR